MGVMLVPIKKVPAFLGVDEAKFNEVTRQDPSFPKPVRFGGAKGMRYYYVEELRKWKANQVESSEMLFGLSYLLSKYGIDITDPLRATSGVYLLYKDGALIYVGQSVNVYSRIPQHRNKDFDRAMFIPCQKAVLDAVESALIAVLCPKLNGSPPIRGIRLVDLQELVEIGDGDEHHHGGSGNLLR